MNNEVLYRKTMKGKRTVYEPVQSETEPVAYINLTDGQMISAVATLGTVLLMLAERNFPEHKLLHRKIKAVEAAILDLYNGTGQHVDLEICDHFCATWDRVLKELSAEVSG